MEIKEFIKLEDEVKQILIDDPKTRNDDMFLYWVYCKNKFKNVWGEFITCVHFENFFLSSEARKKHKIKPFETVSRCRRKIQAQCPELASDRTIKKLKKLQEEEFKAYAKL